MSKLSICVQFSKQTVIDSYISFIEHFPRAEKVLDEVSTKSSFQKFVEVGFVCCSLLCTYVRRRLTAADAHVCRFVQNFETCKGKR